MRSHSDDRTARARIRDEALRLFADQGADAVTVRAVASAADVSPALVIRHFGAKDGLRAAVDDHVAGVFESLLQQTVLADEVGPFAPGAVPALAAQVIGRLPPGSPVPAYLGRMLLEGRSAGSALFRRLYTVSRDVLAEMAEKGVADPGEDPAVRAAFLLVNDLAVLMLRPHIGAVVGVDLATEQGMRRWGDEVLSIYRSGLGGCAIEEAR
ncbi:TetR/AcrR family transcriptional regulator [Nocardia sp. CA-290969]|uniref:TetR/AcrR family transcriptional regulator n=1 Tax=Nocardia sp. CA-290969 TaxID=3239986 RepID=UPI003D90BF70